MLGITIGTDPEGFVEPIISIRPCPFCGSEAELHTEHEVAIKCSNCNASMSLGESGDLDVLVLNWNCRDGKQFLYDDIQYANLYKSPQIITLDSLTMWDRVEKFVISDEDYAELEENSSPRHVKVEPKQRAFNFKDTFAHKRKFRK